MLGRAGAGLQFAAGVFYYLLENQDSTLVSCFAPKFTFKYQTHAKIHQESRQNSPVLIESAGLGVWTFSFYSE